VKPIVFLPAVASGVLLWTTFFPLNLGPLAFVALVPWLTLVRAPVTNRQRYLAAYLGGVVFFLLATEWIRVAHPMMYMSWVGLSVVMPLFWLLALAIIRQFDRLGLPLALAVPLGWVALEYCRMHFPTGFPFMKVIGAYQMIGFGWYFLGYTQHEFSQLIQIADLGGVYAVSFVVAAVNGALTDVAMRTSVVRRLLKWEDSSINTAQENPDGQGVGETLPPAANPPGGRGRVGGIGLVIATLLLLTSIGYGYFRLQHAAFADGPLVAAIQGNMAQGDKMGRPDQLIKSYSDLHLQAFHQQPQPELIIWPETCCPVDWCDIVPGAKQEGMPSDFKREWVRAQDEFLDRGWNTYVLFGLNGLEWDGERVRKYNSAFLVKPLPKPEGWLPKDPTIHQSAPVARYDKMHLVPFGEYVPLGEQLPFMAWFTPYEKDYECRPGEHWTRFPIKLKDGREYTFGCLICYEDSDPYLARQYVAAEPVNFLVNISNDGWFNGTEEHEQHLAICRFRAIEARRSVVRSVNMGISGVIDADGHVIALPNPDWSKSKKTTAVVTAVVPIDTRQPLYATLGDWVPAVCWTAVLVGLILVRRRKPAA